MNLGHEMKQELKRLAPTTDTLRRLLLRSGNQCAFPNCTHVIFNDHDLLVAECCHIEAALSGGERFNPLQTVGERRSYGNLLFLCKRHHAETNDVGVYDVAALKKIKSDHEGRFREHPFPVKPGYVDQVSDALKRILDIVQETVERVRRIDENLLKALDQNLAAAEVLEPALQYFGCPEVFRFNGRIAELGAWYRDIDRYNTFLIGGISGIGKSTFTAQFVTENKQYSPLWIDCELIHTKALLYEFIAAYARQEFGDKTISPTLKTLDEQSVNRAIVSFFRQHLSCIVFDGLNDKLTEFEPILKLLNNGLDRSKVIISSKSNIETSQWKNPVYKISLSGLDRESFSKLLIVYHGADVPSEQVLGLHRLLNGHPYVLKLAVSLLEYQSVERFIEQLKAQNPIEINAFIQQKALELLNAEELSLLKKIAAFQVPFRYVLGDFVCSNKFDLLFRALKDRFLVEIFQKDFFIIPEFIKSYILAEATADKKDVELFRTFTRYLNSIKKDPRIFEKIAIVYHALSAEMNDFAKDQAKLFLSALMADGQFNLALNIAAQMASEPGMASWWFIYYSQGRVCRFLDEYEAALAHYDRCFKCDADSSETEIVQFERASILSLLAKENDEPELLEQAKAIYGQLTTSAEQSRAVQSEVSLGALELRTGNYQQALDRLLAVTEKVGVTEVQVNVQASYWQTLGDTYSQLKEYKKAFEAFDKSCDLYKMAIEKFGMNTIDGLYHLYDSYGWTFAKAGDYNGATEMFACCVVLSNQYNLRWKKEKALFDYGYHLFMNHEFQAAADVASLHYQFIRENELMDELDMPFIYGVLASSHWYSGDMINAVELVGLHILESIHNGRRPMVSLVEADGLMEEIDFVEFFHKKAYLFIIPSGKTFADFREWVANVIETKPYLTGPLSDFMPLTNDDG